MKLKIGFSYIVPVLFFLVSANVYSQALTIGTTEGYPPFASRADKQGHFLGFEIDLMNAICNRIQATCTYQPVIIGTIQTELLANKIDFAIATITIPQTPVPGFIFSQPYMNSTPQFMTLSSSTINTASDLKGKTIGLRHGTIEGGAEVKTTLQQMYNNQLTFKDYATMGDLLSGLSNNEVDAIITNSAALHYWYNNNANVYRLIGDPLSIGNGYGIMSTPKYNALMQQINTTIDLMKKDGSYAKIYDNYFSTLK